MKDGDTYNPLGGGADQEVVAVQDDGSDASPEGPKRFSVGKASLVVLPLAGAGFAVLGSVFEMDK